MEQSEGYIHKEREVDDSRLEALKVIDTLQIPQTENALAYRNQRHGWVRWLLERKGPCTDKRFWDKEGVVPDPYESTHRPAEITSPVHSGESSSWNFQVRAFLTEKWQHYRQHLTDLILHLSDEKYEVPFEQMRGEIRKDFWHHFNRYGELLHQNGFESSHRQRVTVAGSGADAIRTAYELTCSSLPEDSMSALAATTTENGSGVYELPLGEGGANVVSLRHDHHEEDDTNREITDEDLVTFYTQKIDEGVGFISLTLASKTGVRYDISHSAGPSVMKQVLEYATKKNAQEQQVVVILDAVQLVGRVPLAEILSYLKIPGVSGLVHTGSKGPGGSPHAGFVIWSELGQSQVTTNIEKLDVTQRAKVVKNLRAREVVYNPYRLLPEVNRHWDTMTAIRAMDNLDAVEEAEDLVTHPEYMKALAQIYEFYTTVFHETGFRILPNDIPNIIAMEPPEGLKSEASAHLFLGKMAEQGYGFGGFLKENYYPIFRWGISIHLIDLVLKGEVELETFKADFIAAITEAKNTVSST